MSLAARASGDGPPGRHQTPDTVTGRKLLFCVCSLGLGHATRSTSLIRHLAGRNRIFILSTGSALAVLRKEFASAGVTFFDFPDYPPLERGAGIRYFLFLLQDAGRMHRAIGREQRFVEQLVRDHAIEGVIADGRYGGFSRQVPCVLLTHQISFALGKTLRFARGITDRFNRHIFRRFTSLIIPDFSDPERNLAGRLSHHPMLAQLPHEYVGLLSSLPHLERTKDIDYLFIISGFLEEHRGDFVRRIFQESRNLPGKKVFVLGDFSRDEHRHDGAEIEIYSHAAIELRNELMARARTVISRSGYTTVMDLVELDLAGVLVPTPNQSEQEYLGHYLGAKGYFATFPSQESFTLQGLPEKLAQLTPFRSATKTADSLGRIEAHLARLFRATAASR